MNRRNLLGALLAAPAIIRPGLLMRVKPPLITELPVRLAWSHAEYGSGVVTRGYFSLLGADRFYWIEDRIQCPRAF